MFRRPLADRWLPLALFAPMLILGSATVAQAAVTVDDSYSVVAGGTIAEAAPGVLSNDQVRDGVSAVLVSSPTGGELTFAADGGFTYVHDGVSTSDSFSYQAEDELGLSEVATVSIVVVQPGAPDAAGDSYAVVLGGTLEIAAPGVLGNDTDPEGDPLTATLASPPQHAAEFSLAADGSFVYVHDGTSPDSGSDGGGGDSFTYLASDGTATSGEVTVTIDVQGATTTPATVIATFPEIAEVELGSHLGTINGAAAGLLELGLSASLTVPAAVQGTSGVAQTSIVVLQVTDGAYLATAADQFAKCERLALVAQARSSQYQFEIEVNLLDGQSITEASAERILVSLPTGTIHCRLRRMP